ncbi:MAG: hypothetical protein FJ318_07415 [SAR202 cluster bacterium]|nr:hypothetical protein [SAR202 cluster bacterium]
MGGKSNSGAAGKGRPGAGDAMPTEAILGMVAFGAMFTMWVVLPSKLRARAERRSEIDSN